MLAEGLVIVTCHNVHASCEAASEDEWQASDIANKTSRFFAVMGIVLCCSNGSIPVQQHLANSCTEQF